MSPADSICFRYPCGRRRSLDEFVWLNGLSTVSVMVMKKCNVVLLAVMSLSSFFVCGGVLPIDGLPVPECADTEVSTNIPIRVDLDRMDKMRFVVIREMIIRGCCC